MPGFNRIYTGVLCARFCLIAGATAGLASSSFAQGAPQGPPAVGVVVAHYEPIAETTEVNGRIQARQRVDLVARVTAFLNEQAFTEGAEVKKDQILYRLERAPFEADVEAKSAAVSQAQAQLENANLTLSRAQELLQHGSGTQVAYDAALAADRTSVAQVKVAQAQLRESQISLDYTEIKSPIDGRIGRTAVTIGNVVSPTSGVLATIVSADPMYVVFPISVRRLLELRDRYADKGGFDAVRLRLRLANGKMFGQVGKLDFLDIDVAKDTDTISLRGTVANPALHAKVGGNEVRELSDNEFVTVIIESVEPLKVLAIPSAAVLSDQQGDYVYAVGAQNKAEVRRIKLGQSTANLTGVTDGLKDGDRIVVEGIQRVRPNAEVAPVPAKNTGS